MVSQTDHLHDLTLLPTAATEEERIALWRLGMATLARAAQDQQPVPLEGIDSELLQKAVAIALESNLLQELDWLSEAGAAAALYELANALPEGDERRALGRMVLTRMLEGPAETFVTLATSLAAESRRTLSGPAMRTRMALSLALPIGITTADTLALMMLSRSQLRREWLTDAATGSLPSRRLAARLLERAAREAARRTAQGDPGCLLAFRKTRVRQAWAMLLADRESLVWRHVATARGLLSNAMPEFLEEIENHLDPQLGPTEWRRAAVSLAARVTIDPQDGLARCRALLEDDTYLSDTGLAATMIYGLSQVAEAEPEIGEELLELIALRGGIDVAEALVELRRERMDPDLGKAAEAHCLERLQALLNTKTLRDDGKIALCDVLIEELSSPTLVSTTLRGKLDAALAAFAEKDARTALSLAQQTFAYALGKLSELEQLDDGAEQQRHKNFRLLREIDVALLETATLSDLLLLGQRTSEAKASADPLGELFERLTAWLLFMERASGQQGPNVSHLTLRLRRLRALLHLVDADGSHGEDTTGQRRKRRLSTVQLLLQRAQLDSSSPLRRTLCAALTRTCDAMLRDELCELSDVVLLLSDHVKQAHDLEALAEASMIDHVQKSMRACASVAENCQGDPSSGRSTRAAINALLDVAQALPWAGTVRVRALRRALMELASDLETFAMARSLQHLASGPERSALHHLSEPISAVARLTASARQRVLFVSKVQQSQASGVLSALDMGLEQQLRHQDGSLKTLHAQMEQTLLTELPNLIGQAISLVLARLAVLPLAHDGQRVDTFVPPASKEAPLPPWLPARRTLGGFYVQRALGAGGVGTVFVVVRTDERTRPDATRFALKVPDYNAEAARTLSEQEFLQLFREEAGALLSLPSHRNLASFVTFDAGAKPKPILVMELVEGPTLERALELRDMSMSEAFDLLDGIAAGLQSMHAGGLGHLDLKPSNVILRDSGGVGVGATPVLVDFGLAGRHIRPGCATGSYGSPEIWGLVPEDDRPTPMAADTYAYACMVFELLTGSVLFEGATEMATINAHLVHDGYPKRLLVLREMPQFKTLSDLIANGLRQRPGDRIQVAQLRKGLRQLAPSLSSLSWPIAVP